MKIRITGRGQNRALIDPLTGKKVFVSNATQKSNHDPKKALLEAVL